jgi:membrane associated rhomboid family serine protease
MRFFLLLVVPGLILYFMSPEERKRLLLRLQDFLEYTVERARQRRAEPDPFRDALRARTRRALVTPAIVALNGTIFVCMLFGAGAFSDPATLLGWGASFGPRTTNGEWWRLLTATCVHSGMIALLVNAAGLIQAGLITERLAGPVAMVTVYISAGLAASLVNLSNHPMAVSFGASGAVFGVYGLLLATSMWSRFDRSDVTIPLATAKSLVPAAAIFILYHTMSDGLDGAAEVAGFATGCIWGLVMTRGVGERKPTVGRIAFTLAATAAIAVVMAVPMRGISDVRPELARVVAVEGRTAKVYGAAVDRFKIGRTTAEALAKLIERTIIPELQATNARLETINGIPPEHQPLVAAAKEYLRLRDESWHLRAEALHKGSMVILQGADKVERSSLEAFTRIKTADLK